MPRTAVQSHANGSEAAGRKMRETKTTGTHIYQGIIGWKNRFLRVKTPDGKSNPAVVSRPILIPFLHVERGEENGAPRAGKRVNPI